MSNIISHTMYTLFYCYTMFHGDIPIAIALEIMKKLNSIYMYLYVTYGNKKTTNIHISIKFICFR